MRMRRLAATALVAMAMTGLALPANAESSGYIPASILRPRGRSICHRQRQGTNQHVLSRQQGQ